MFFVEVSLARPWKSIFQHASCLMLPFDCLLKQRSTSGNRRRGFAVPLVTISAHQPFPNRHLQRRSLSRSGLMVVMKGWKGIGLHGRSQICSFWDMGLVEHAPAMVKFFLVLVALASGRTDILPEPDASLSASMQPWWGTDHLTWFFPRWFSVINIPRADYSVDKELSRTP